MLNFLKEDDLVFFPSDELLRAEALSSSRELLSQRLYALGQLLSPTPKILITHPSALLRYLPNPARFQEEILTFKVGESYDLLSLKEKLISLGYQGVAHVDHSLQFASRGDILDIYSVSYSDPVRIEFFGDEIDSIRFFNTRSQQSKEEVKSCVILPATDIFLNDEEMASFGEKVKAKEDEDCRLLDEDTAKMLRENVGTDLEHFVEHDYQQSLYRYYGFALGEAFSVLDYFSPRLVYITNKDQFDTGVKQLQQEAADFYREQFLKGRCLSRLGQYMTLEQAIPSSRNLVCSSPFATSPDDCVFATHHISAPSSNLAQIVPLIQTYLTTNDKVLLSLNEVRQKQTVMDFLDDAKIPYEQVEGLTLPEGKLGITENPVSEGFEIPLLRIACITSNELFGRRAVTTRFTSRFKNASILRSYQDLKPGDYVVHEYNGIGQFLDIKTIEVDGVHRDFLHIAYANHEFLYVPLEQFRLVRKYSGGEGAVPKLSSLSSGEWSKRKEKIQKRINELADRLVALYGKRAKTRGFCFPPDDDLQRQFEQEFPYPLTDDQQKAVDDTKADMESDVIMDRLICGDVGFGKTEVAFRAVFKAIDAGKQVAMLAPTTLLARQHYELACKRFADFGVRVGLLSRLVPEEEQKKTIEGLAKGDVDFVIGTHRLLSTAIHYKDLGLLVIDEEQRFGVEQKERIKEMKTDVDVLTLSATPIPRTLQMSLVGIRPISEINTPPASRMPIQTYVTPFKQDVVDELISRELARGGQVFYVHNKVATIYATATKLSRRIPDAAIGVVHGQMEKEESEDVMNQFYEGKINVLICTSIVENGIDVPNANLIIVEDADTFGLSQLYQIKGRVGRGGRIAYAYLMYRPQKNMNEAAQKRLKAIQEFTELGSGYKIAQRDLMIRGAGDILGPEQAGFIDSVGFDLYLKMLNEAVTERTTGKKERPRVAHKLFNIDAYIPKDYASEGDKLSLYQELDAISDNKGLAEFEKKVRDIYGKLPEETELLIQKKRIDLLAENPEFTAIDEGDDYVDISINDLLSHIDGAGTELFDALSPYLRYFRMTYFGKKLKIRFSKHDGWLKDLEGMLGKIHGVALKFGIASQSL